jgi:hypothetical protein
MERQRKKEQLFVQVPIPDGTVEFHDVTQHVGRQMPFKSPKATCGMRVSDSVVAFSLLHLTKKTSSVIAEKELTIPRGPLARLERRAEEIAADLADGQILIEADDLTQLCVVSRDDNGVVSIDPTGDDVAFELPRSAVKFSAYLNAPALKRVIAIGFIGHPGKPGTPTTLRRVASMALFSLTQLSQFRVLTDIETVTIPPSPRVAPVLTRRSEDQAAAVVPLWLFSDSNPPAPVAAGYVNVEVDLDSANHATGRLLYHYTPSAEIEEHFGDYRAIIDSTIGSLMRAELGEDEIKAITVDIVLGEVNSGTTERLRAAMVGLAAGLDLTPRMFQFHQA